MGSVILVILALAGIGFSSLVIYSALKIDTKSKQKINISLLEIFKKGNEAMEGANKIVGTAQTYVKDARSIVNPELWDQANKLVSGMKELLNKTDELTNLKLLQRLLSTVSSASAKLLGASVSQYNYVITEDPNHPFQLNGVISDTAQKVVYGKKTDRAKAKAIFDWFLDSIKYGESKRRKHGKRYRTSAEVFIDSEGVCGEMAVLYVVMARSVGLRANYVSVRIDEHGQKVNHACATVEISGKNVLVDPAYYTFDVKHGDFEILTDKTAVPHFKSMRN